MIQMICLMGVPVMAQKCHARRVTASNERGRGWLVRRRVAQNRPDCDDNAHEGSDAASRTSVRREKFGEGDGCGDGDGDGGAARAGTVRALLLDAKGCRGPGTERLPRGCLSDGAAATPLRLRASPIAASALTGPCSSLSDGWAALRNANPPPRQGETTNVAESDATPVQPALQPVTDRVVDAVFHIEGQRLASSREGRIARAGALA